jgi:hypothetical protein
MKKNERVEEYLHHSWSCLHMEVSGRFHATVTLFQEKGPHNPVDRRLLGPQRQSGRCAEEKISGPCRELNPRRPASRYIDWAVSRHLNYWTKWQIWMKFGYEYYIITSHIDFYVLIYTICSTIWRMNEPPLAPHGS